MIFENLQWHFNRTTDRIRNAFPGSVRTKTGAGTVRTKTGIDTVRTKTVALEVRKTGNQRKVTKLNPLVPTKTGNYKILEVDELEYYGDYQQPWKLDSGASGHYCGPSTGVWYKKKARASK